MENRPSVPGRVVRTNREPGFVVRGAGDAGPHLIKAVWNSVLAIHPDADITRARTIPEEIAQVLYPRRLGAAILTLSGLFGLLLSVVGLYGVMSYSAARRTREIGVRSALGAERKDILALLMREALLSLVVGIGCGVAIGYGVVRIVSSKVVAIPMLDTFTLVVVPALLSVIILAACLVPALRAVRMNTVDVLRTQ